MRGSLASLLITAMTYLVRMRNRVCNLGSVAPSLLCQGVLIVAVCLLYLGHLHLFANDLDIERLSANRFVEGLPIDNKIPSLFAERIIRGEKTSDLVSGWLSSDRPPLQTGLILLYHPVAQLLQVDPKLAAHAVGMLVQLAWIPALWSLIRRFRVSQAGTVVMLTTIAVTTTPLINSLYVWPKLGAAAAVVGAYTLYFWSPDKSLARTVIAALLCAIGWLLHGGIAFSVLGMAIVALFSRHPAWRTLCIAMAVTALIAAPWFVYQKGYDPPGNRLLKWHLAGVEGIDERGFGESLRTAYAEKTVDEIIENKRSNFVYPFYYLTATWWDFGREGVAARRFPEFYFLFSALGLWNVGWIGLPWTTGRLWRQHRQRHSRNVGEVDRHEVLRAVGWCIATFVVWGLLMFGPATTSIHSGSLVLPLVATTGLMMLAREIHQVLFGSLVAWQWLHFIVVWLPATSVTEGPIRPFAAGLMICAGISFVTLAWATRSRTKQSDCSAV